jgi:hypothetical protein
MLEPLGGARGNDRPACVTGSHAFQGGAFGARQRPRAPPWQGPCTTVGMVRGTLAWLAWGLILALAQVESGCSKCPQLEPYCEGDFQVIPSYENSTDCGMYNSIRHDCALNDGTCRDGMCVPAPKEPCPNGGDGVCDGNWAYRCEDGYLRRRGEFCSSSETECLLVPADGGHVQAVCAVSSDPCRSVTDGAECQGDRWVRCRRGFPVEMEACDAPTERCVVIDPEDDDGPRCALALPCPPAGSTVCAGDLVYRCDADGIVLPLRDCATLGHHCMTIAGRALCSVDQAGPADLEFVSIQGGTFRLLEGEPPPTADVSDFEMLVAEVTVAQYAACEMAGDCTARDEEFRSDPSGLGAWFHGDLPVTNVGFEQAGAFCAFVDARLPTEVEWEFALRNGGQNVSYPWGEAFPDCAHAILHEAPQPGCSRGEPWPACSRADDVTEHGVCDLVGNLEEWVVPVLTPSIPSGVRGESFSDYNIRNIHVTYPAPYGEAYSTRGFRCVR